MGRRRRGSAEHLLADLWLTTVERLAATPLAARLSTELCAEVSLGCFVLSCSHPIPCFPEIIQAYDGSSDVSELGKFCSWKKLKLLKIFQPSLRYFQIVWVGCSKVILLVKAILTSLDCCTLACKFSRCQSCALHSVVSISIITHPEIRISV